MATADEIAALRRATNILTDADPYTDEYLGTLLDSLGHNGSAEALWLDPAARYTTLANVSEGTSSRSLGQLHDHAMKMVQHFRDAAATPTPTEASGMSLTWEVERA